MTEKKEEFDVLVGGSPIVHKAALYEPKTKAFKEDIDASLEYPCADCGRTVCLGKASQELLAARAMGEDTTHTEWVSFGGAPENPDHSGVPIKVICGWCAFKEEPLVIEHFNRVEARAKEKLGLI